MQTQGFSEHTIAAFRAQQVYEMKLQLKTLSDALEMCTSEKAKEQKIILEKAVNAVTDTIKRIEGGEDFHHLRAFKIQVHFDSDDNEEKRAIMNVRLDQVRTSISLPINHYLVIIPPVGEHYKTPRTIEKNCVYNYTHDFDLGDRSGRNFSMLKASDFVFKIYKIPPGVYDKDPVLVGTANVPLAPMAFSPFVQQTLEFMNPKGKDTGYAFEAKITMDTPLTQNDGVTIDDVIRVFEI